MDAELVYRREDLIGWIMGIRRKRAQLFGDDLFSDPAWEILLELYSARLERRTLTLDKMASGSPVSTLTRWAGVLERRGLVACMRDPFSPSIVRIELDEQAALRMAELFRTPPPPSRDC